MALSDRRGCLELSSPLAVALCHTSSFVMIHPSPGGFQRLPVDFRAAQGLTFFYILNHVGLAQSRPMDTLPQYLAEGVAQKCGVPTSLPVSLSWH